MNYFEWIFIVINGVVSIAGINYWTSRQNANGVSGLATPAGWCWVWQAAGTYFIPFYLGWSVWHLVWWFPVGFIVCSALGRILYLLGILRF